MKQSETAIRKQADRRSFLKTSLTASAATVGVGLLSNSLSALGADHDGGITEGDAAILRFLAAAEILRIDLPPCRAGWALRHPKNSDQFAH